MTERWITWSAQYKLSQSPKQQLSGDKIILPPSALEALLSANSDLAAANARQNLPAYDPFDHSTHSAYRRADSEYLERRHQLPHPLTFRLVEPDSGRLIYAGIREFSAEEGEVAVSAHLQDALGLGPERLQVTVHAAQLPKGTFVKLRPLEAGYDVDDWKALLEKHLRTNYTTLTKGDTLTISGGKAAGTAEAFTFLVDELKPESDGICIVDTDLEVDIEALDEDQARETLKRIHEKTVGGPSAGGDLDIFNPVQGQVLQGQYVDYTLPSWDKSQTVEIELEGEDSAGLDLLLSPLSATQRARPRLDEHVFADFDSWPRKRIRLEPTNVKLENAEALYISVHSYAPKDSHDSRLRKFTIRAHHPSPSPSSKKPDSHEGDVRCENCKQWVPSGTLILHHNFCYRNNVACTKGCGQIFKKDSLELAQHWHCPHDDAYGNGPFSHEKHNTLIHPPQILRCTECETEETFPSFPLLAHHRTSTCPAKLILCRFCHLVVPQEGDPDVPNAEALLSGMTPHELADGARTTECHLCGKIIRLRDMDAHLKNHDLDRYVRPPPVPCRNVNCGCTLDRCSRSGDTRVVRRKENDLGVCNVCFGPLYVSMYDPEGKALRRRVERRYLQQLAAGCGRGWCRNEFCKTGRRNLGGLETEVSTKEAVPMVRPFLDGNGPLHFCVDEKSQTRRTVAEVLAAEGGLMQGGGYDFVWCLGALEAEDGDVDGAKQWLRNWAPTRK
ncbi:hypothetical protein K470DRAFT_258421 [Piedraia hortae CBS 480.64]|uniref:Uncharacterized protein n=1 Tax=Piedraia hortae CBS 480.64 TaxID=1314780 RepID=A0A6A7BXD5_9PEZI|nr:hypothetical protein K470DRAFT_258421 [Piedraia hortae CBS 480.64]